MIKFDVKKYIEHALPNISNKKNANSTYVLRTSVPQTYVTVPRVVVFSTVACHSIKLDMEYQKDVLIIYSINGILTQFKLDASINRCLFGVLVWAAAIDPCKR